MQVARLLCSNVKSLLQLFAKGDSFSFFSSSNTFFGRVLFLIKGFSRNPLTMQDLWKQLNWVVVVGAPIFLSWPFPSAPLVGVQCTIYAWIWQLRWSCAFYFVQRHSINKEENSLSKNSFGLIRKLNCDRLAVVQFLAHRQSVSLFLESNYSQIIAKDQKLDQEIHRLKCRRKFSFVFHSQTKWNKSFRKSLMNGFFAV